MKYLYESKFSNNDVKKIKHFDKVSEAIGKDLNKKIANSKLNTITIESLENGWYEQVLESDGEYIKRMIEVKNHDVISYVNGNKVRFNTSNLNKVITSLPDYSLTVNYPDGKIIKAKLYLINNKPLKINPEFYEATVFMLYATEPIDGGGLFVRTYGKDINDILYIDEYWNSNSSPRCNEQQKVIKFYLPKGKAINFHAYTKTSFWKGKITTDSNCQSLRLNQTL